MLAAEHRAYDELLRGGFGSVFISCLRPWIGDDGVEGEFMRAERSLVGFVLIMDAPPFLCSTTSRACLGVLWSECTIVNSLPIPRLFVLVP